MAPADITEMGLTDLAAHLAARELSSAEAVSSALERLDRLEGKLNAFITVFGEQARAEARKADDEIASGQYRGPLHGVPVTIKDMFETAGTRTTGGSKILQDWIPDDTRHAGHNHSNLLRFPSMLGLPGCSLPCGMSPEGLPIGMQLIGAWFADQTVLNAAAAFQSATDWHERRPEIAEV